MRPPFAACSLEERRLSTDVCDAYIDGNLVSIAGGDDPQKNEGDV